MAIFLLSPASWAQSACSDWIAKIISAQGQVVVQRKNKNIEEAYPTLAICPGDSVQTGKYARATLQLRNDSLLNLDQNTSLVFSEAQPANQQETSWWINLFTGNTFFRSRRPQRLRVRTPFVNAVHEGTEFLVDVTQDRARILVFDGTVKAANVQGQLKIAAGQAAEARKNQAPKPVKLIIKPEDAVQWALYYPPLVDITYFQNTVSNPLLRNAAQAYQKGRIDEALSLLDKLPAEQQNSNYYLLRAALLLSVGQVDEARQAIETLLGQKPGSSAGLALQAVIAVAKNHKQKALELARRAVTQQPDSSLPHIALAYAYQAAFQIEKAYQSVQTAVDLAPQNALAHALLAELSLATGDTNTAMKAAQRAVQLNPNLARSQNVLGFAHLARFEISEAAEHFTTAITLEPANPLAHLGLGLTKIRRGHLKDGTRLMETAVSLDPNNALMRSYLGKAYYELKQGNFASTEFRLAKQMDPNDPTPWFYDAIYKQTVNRPVEALHDMQKAIELNNNRGVYRSKLLLDSDLAARSASLGRIYNDLGFQKLGLLEGWKSVNTDPGNYSAHRLLADNYATLPRHNIARVSELLQSQLLQPLNLTPIQPQLGQANLLLLDGLGPTDLSFTEFNPLFMRNRAAIQAAGIVAGNDTLGDEIVVSGLWNNYSFSLGQFHYETEGYRPNNDANQNIYTGFIQTQLTPQLSVQTEIRYDEITSGDISQNFSKKRFIRDQRKRFSSFSPRIGVHYTINPNHNIILSFIYKDSNFNRRNRNPLFSFRNFNIDKTTYQAEAEYLLDYKFAHLVIGGGYVNEQETNKKSNKKTHSDTQHVNGFIYSHLNLGYHLTTTLGISVDSFDDNNLDKTLRVNPKIGLLWKPTPSTTFRAAWFKTLKRPLTSNQTIEPTQVAGFNQFFDDTNGTKTTRYGVAVDQTLSDNLFGGLSMSWRDLGIPVENKKFQFDQEERFHRAYLYWTPTTNLSIRTEYSFEQIRLDLSEAPTSPLPSKITTHKVPLGIRYFHPSGIFAQLKTTYINQRTVFDFFKTDSGHDQFWLVDTAVGYRFPKRLGILTIGVKNLFDKQFSFEGYNFSTASAIGFKNATQPERIVFARLLLSFN